MKRRKGPKKPKPERVCIDGQWFRVSAKTGRTSKVPLNWADNTMTDAEHRAWWLSRMRDLTSMWPSLFIAKKVGVRPNQSGTRHLREYQCAMCLQWFKEKETEMDHIQPLGGLDSLDKLKQWVVGASIDSSGYQRLCKDKCHKNKTQEERKLCRQKPK